MLCIRVLHGCAHIYKCRYLSVSVFVCVLFRKLGVVMDLDDLVPVIPTAVVWILNGSQRPNVKGLVLSSMLVEGELSERFWITEGMTLKGIVGLSFFLFLSFVSCP